MINNIVSVGMFSTVMLTKLYGTFLIQRQVVTLK